MELIFETERLLVRKLIFLDLEPFHEMHKNMNVMRYVLGKVITYKEDKKDLLNLIGKYDKKENDFWIYAIERKSDNEFLGTIAFVKDDDNEDEIGYRFLEKYWGNGYGTEIVPGMIIYAKQIGLPSLIACVAIVNVASVKIIKANGFEFVKEFISDDIKLPEQKFKLEL